MRLSIAQRGSSLSETVIVVGVLLALLFGIINFGRALYTYNFVAQLAREGARWAIVRGADCNLLDHCNAQQSDITTYVQSLSEGATVASNISASTIWGTAACTTTHSQGCMVAVTVSYPFQFFLPFVLPGAQITMASTSSMVISQ